MSGSDTTANSPDTTANSSVANILTGNAVHETILNLFTTGNSAVEQTIDSSNPLYYYFRAEQRSLKKKNPFDPADMTGTDSINATGFYELPVNDNVRDEIAFLEDLGLAFRKEGKAYIYDLAEVLYGSAGYFRNLGSTGAKQAFISILYNFILPGRFWTAYHTRSRLPDGVQLSVALEAHMREVFDMVWSLVR
jgi:hypothetical protein